MSEIQGETNAGRLRQGDNAGADQHTHACTHGLFRGFADDLPLMEWLKNNIFPVEARNVDEEFVHCGRAAGLPGDDPGRYDDVCRYVLFRGCHRGGDAKVGMRGVLGEAVVDFPRRITRLGLTAMAYCEQYVRKWKKHALITPAIAPHATYTVSAEHLKEAHAFALAT